MKIFKFGGASVNSAEAVRNVSGILEHYRNEKLFLVFSAMGKTTNAMEKLIDTALKNPGLISAHLDGIKSFHLNIAATLFDDRAHRVFQSLEKIFHQITKDALGTNCSYDEFYDRIAPYGELLSTTIVGSFLKDQGFMVCEVSASETIITNNRFRDAAVDWKLTAEKINDKVNTLISGMGCNMLITQGFIGATATGHPTTLGREGSDFTASILAYCLDADEVVVWKDVDGLLNADPALFDDTTKIDHISYHEVIELSFFGAKILHPKTIKPLQNKSIPLRIKSFYNPNGAGTLINNRTSADGITPFLIKKFDQVLVSFISKDFSFITEDKLHKLFGVFNAMNIKINLMQNSAISFTIITNHPAGNLQQMIDDLSDDFDIRYNTDIELLTIRNFNEDIINRLLAGHKILLEQRSRRTIQVAYLCNK